MYLLGGSEVPVRPLTHTVYADKFLIRFINLSYNKLDYTTIEIFFCPAKLIRTEFICPQIASSLTGHFYAVGYCIACASILLYI